MSKCLRCITALLLVPCLVADPALGPATTSRTMPTAISHLFFEEAFSPRTVNTPIIGNPEPKLEEIQAPDIRIFFGDELTNPPAMPVADSNEAFQPVTDKLVRFAGYAFQLPDYMVPLLDVRFWREESGHRTYAVMGPGRSRKEFTRIEFRVRSIPDIRLRFELSGDVRVTFTRHSTATSETVRWTLQPGQTRTLRQFNMARHFMDAALNIPLDPGEARAKAVRDWLLRLDKEGRATRRDGWADIGLGVGHGHLNMPHEIVRGAAQVHVISEWGQNSRYLMLLDVFNNDHFLIFETNPEGRIFDIRSGAEIPGRDTQSRYSYNPIDLGSGRTFFQNMSRVLGVTRKRANVTTGYRLRPDQSKCELGLPLHGEYTIIKVQDSTSLTPTGGSGAGRRSRESATSDLANSIAFPLLLADPAIENPEPISPTITEAAHQNNDLYITLPQSQTAPPFLGYAAGPNYLYWKRLQGTITVQGQERVIYRRLSSEMEHVVLQAQMVSDDAFTITGVQWTVGPQKGLPVLFNGRINLLLLIGKYGDGEVFSLPRNLRDAFAEGQYTLGDGPYLIPEIVFDKGFPRVVGESAQLVKSFAPLEEQAREEQKQLEKAIGPAAPTKTSHLLTAHEFEQNQISKDPNKLIVDLEGVLSKLEELLTQSNVTRELLETVAENLLQTAFSYHMVLAQLVEETSIQSLSQRLRNVSSLHTRLLKEAA